MKKALVLKKVPALMIAFTRYYHMENGTRFYHMVVVKSTR